MPDKVTIFPSTIWLKPVNLIGGDPGPEEEKKQPGHRRFVQGYMPDIINYEKICKSWDMWFYSIPVSCIGALFSLVHYPKPAFNRFILFALSKLSSSSSSLLPIIFMTDTPPKGTELNSLSKLYMYGFVVVKKALIFWSD